MLVARVMVCVSSDTPPARSTPRVTAGALLARFTTLAVPGPADPPRALSHLLVPHPILQTHASTHPPPGLRPRCHVPGTQYRRMPTQHETRQNAAALQAPASQNRPRRCCMPTVGLFKLMMVTTGARSSVDEGRTGRRCRPPALPSCDGGHADCIWEHRVSGFRLADGPRGDIARGCRIVAR